MKDLLLWVHAVVKTLNLEISRRHLADYVKERADEGLTLATAAFLITVVIQPLSTRLIKPNFFFTSKNFA